MHITLHLTDDCNMACRYCYARKGSRSMSDTTAKLAVAKFADHENCGIIFFGGEPLLHKELIVASVEWAEKEFPHRFHYKITTNGLLLTEEFANFAAEHRIHIALSHDGVKEAHDIFRVDAEGKGTFERLQSKIYLLLSLMPYSPVMMTVNPENVEYYCKSVKFLADIGFQYLICSLNFAGNWNDKSLKKLKKEYAKLAEWHYENYLNEKKIYFSPFDKRIASHIFPDRECSCLLGLRQISVGPDGTFYPCVQFVGDANFAIGSADTGIDKERQSSIFNRNEEPKPLCTECALERRCHNKCGCLNYQTTGDITEIPTILCEHERMIFPIVDRLAEKLYSVRSPMFLHRHYNANFPIISFLEDLSV